MYVCIVYFHLVHVIITSNVEIILDVQFIIIDMLSGLSITGSLHEIRTALCFSLIQSKLCISKFLGPIYASYFVRIFIVRK